MRSTQIRGGGAGWADLTGAVIAVRAAESVNSRLRRNRTLAKQAAANPGLVTAGTDTGRNRQSAVQCLGEFEVTRPRPPFYADRATYDDQGKRGGGRVPRAQGSEPNRGIIKGFDRRPIGISSRGAS
jgi:hypothetical protein